MADKLIRASVLKDMMFNYYPCVNKTTNKRNFSGDTLMAYEVADLIEDSIDNAPSVDAVLVVRCKDCMFSSDVDCSEPKYRCGNLFRDGCKQWVGSDDFCSYGERKDGDTE